MSESTAVDNRIAPALLMDDELQAIRDRDAEFSQELPRNMSAYMGSPKGFIVDIRALLGHIEAQRLALTAAGSPKVQVCEYTIGQSPDPSIVFVAHASGEAGSFKANKLAEYLAKFWTEEF